MKLVIADPPAGNVYIREGPSKLSPSIGKPAYNYNQFRVIYTADEEREIDGVKWLHLSGWGWSMAEFFKDWEPEQLPAPSPPADPADPADPAEGWILGLSRTEVLELIDYLSAAVKGDD